MFSNCPTDEILPAVRKALYNVDKSQFKIKFLNTYDLIYLFQSILRINIILLYLSMISVYKNNEIVVFFHLKDYLPDNSFKDLYLGE